MSRREKNVEITETEIVDENGKAATELKLGTKSLGLVTDDEGKVVAVLPSGEKFRVSSQSEAMTLLIRDYHLHRG